MIRKFVIGDKIAIIDDIDIDNFNKYKWNLKDGLYLSTTQKRTSIYFHRMIMGFPDGIVDHINRNTLDNRRSNLRVVNKSQNAMNSKMRIDNNSGFNGISFRKDRNKWHSYININKKRINIGYYKNKEEAINKRIEFEKELFKEYSPL